MNPRLQPLLDRLGVLAIVLARAECFVRGSHDWWPSPAGPIICWRCTTDHPSLRHRSTP